MTDTGANPSNVAGTNASTAVDPSTALGGEATMPGAPSAGAPATPAATVVALRDGGGGPEVLLLRRQRGGAFGGLWVFPGGKVEAVDAERAGVAAPGGFAPGHLSPEDEIALAREAAVREAMEEAQLRLAPEDLEVHSYWMPPPEAPRRFSTWFFVARAGPDGEIVVDGSEVHEYRWLTAGAAMAERDAGTLALAPPTWMTLWQVSRHPDAASVLTEARSRPPLRFESHIWGRGEDMVFVWDGDAAYEDGDLSRPGPRRRMEAGLDRPWRAEVGTAGGDGG
jgi:8-oxo-dGTP pyrophosphatase MutT (NUDIX family)